VDCEFSYRPGTRHVRREIRGQFTYLRLIIFMAI
jgi:hypothetical protein